jgi:uncharacterized protein (TIGR04222 family)
MNPLDLPGKIFLPLYAVVSAILIAVAALFRWRMEGGGAPKINLDPYLISYLRGDIQEVVRVATIWLVERKLLQVEGNTLSRAENASPTLVSDPVERWILTKTERQISGLSLVARPPEQSVSAPLEEHLQKHGLLPDSEMNWKRIAIFFPLLCALLATSSLKILKALSLGKTNILFLIFLTLAASFTLSIVCFPRISARGHTMVEDLQTLYSRLRDRAPSIRSGSFDTDALMLAAVFGIELLPASHFGYVSRLFPMRASEGGTGGETFCDSTCGVGGGCGGCGGGCGGCGS